MTTGHDEPAKRCTAKRRTALVLEILRGDTSVAEAARKHGVTVADIEAWRERFLSGAENALRSRPLNEDAQKDQEIKRLKQKVGELVMAVDSLKEATKANPSWRQMSDEYVPPCRLPRCVTSAAFSTCRVPPSISQEQPYRRLLRCGCGSRRRIASSPHGFTNSFSSIQRMDTDESGRYCAFGTSS